MAISNKNKLSDILKRIIGLSISWELFNIDEARQLYDELILYAEDKRQFFHTDEELLQPPREYWERYSSSNQAIYIFANALAATRFA